MPLVAKIIFSIVIVAWAAFLCTIGRSSLTWLYGSVFCSRNTIVGIVLFTDDGEIRPAGAVGLYSVMLAVVWFASQVVAPNRRNV